MVGTSVRMVMATRVWRVDEGFDLKGRHLGCVSVAALIGQGVCHRTAVISDPSGRTLLTTATSMGCRVMTMDRGKMSCVQTLAHVALAVPVSKRVL